MNTSTHPDVLVLGLGAMGSATLLHLARLGVRVLGVDQFSPPHAFGSTHGETRVTRVATGEGADYVPLAQRSHQLWREYEAQTGAQLFTACGGLMIAKDGALSLLHEQRDFLGATIANARAFVGSRLGFGKTGHELSGSHRSIALVDPLLQDLDRDGVARSESSRRLVALR